MAKVRRFSGGSVPLFASGLIRPVPRLRRPIAVALSGLIGPRA
jgi:hypothetical protein